MTKNVSIILFIVSLNLTHIEVVMRDAKYDTYVLCTVDSQNQYTTESKCFTFLVGSLAIQGVKEQEN
jgi:hypothetical protein